MTELRRRIQPLTTDSAPAPEALVREHAAAVLAVCLSNTKSVHDAEDAMQDVFVKALAGLDKLRDPRKAKPWLLQIARRTCIDY